MLKVKSVSDLAFKALNILTDGEDELWVAHIVFDGQAQHTGDIQNGWFWVFILRSLIPTAESDIYTIIHWWENELTDQERAVLMGDYKWHGSIEDRHIKLREMHQSYKSDNIRKNKDEF